MTAIQTPPDERAPNGDRRRLVQVLLAVAVLLVAADAGLAWAIDRHRATSAMNRMVVAGKWDHLASAPAYDAILVGDSSGLFGADAALIGRLTGLRCYNACAFGSLGLANEAWLMQFLAEQGRLPKVVVAIHVHDIWPRDASVVLGRLDAFEGAPWERWEPRLTAARGSWRMQDAIPLAAAPRDAQAMLLGRWYDAIGHERLRADGSGILPQPDVRLVRSDVAAARERLARAATAAPVLSPFTRASLAAMHAVVLRHPVRLVFAEAPVAEALAADPAYQRHLERVRSEVIGCFPGASVAWIASGRRGYPEQDMQNADHLAAPDDRADFSTRIGTALQQLLPAR